MNKNYYLLLTAQIVILNAKNMAHLTTEYAGISLKNPIIAASSGLTSTIEGLLELQKAGIGAVVLKSIFEEEILMEMEQAQHQMTGRPYVFPETMDYMDQEPQLDIIRSYLELIKQAKAQLDIPVIASINCVSNQKWTYLAEEISKAGADALELNIFSLPSNTSKDSTELESEYIKAVTDVKSKTTIPVMVKISPYFTSIARFIDKLEKAKIEAVVLFNRFYSPDINLDTLEVQSSFIMSNENEFTLPLRWTSLLSQKYKLSFAATTGIHSAPTAIKMLLAGADAVQIASILYKNGLNSIEQLKAQILDWMKQNGYSSINDFKGKLAHDKGTNNAAWERTQFMKEFKQFT